MDQTDDQIIKFYSLRFQIELIFRAAKQFWGLEDFMNVKEIAVTQAANLSLFMVNFSAAPPTQSILQHTGLETTL